MSKMTYTDGSYTIYGNCYCNQTVCRCGSIVHIPRQNTIQKLFNIITVEETLRLRKGQMKQFDRVEFK